MSNRPAGCVPVRPTITRAARPIPGTPGTTGPTAPAGGNGALGVVSGGVIIQLRAGPIDPPSHRAGRHSKERPPMRLPSVLRLVAAVLAGSLFSARPAPAQNAEE